MGATRHFSERIVKSFGFSLTLFALWGGLTALKARSLFDHFASLECAWVSYNATIAILFLVRSRPSIVSLNPVHWFVALITSFAGLFFARSEQTHHEPWHTAAGRNRYEPAQRIEMYRHLTATICRLQNDLPISLCLEERAVFEELGLTASAGRCNCVL